MRRTYSSLRARQDAQDELFELLKDMTEKDGVNILRRIRAGDDIVAILNQAKDGNLLMQLSLMPETHRRYKLPYTVDMPEFIISSGSPYLDTLLYHTPPSTHERSSLLTHDDSEGTGSSKDMYLMPYHAAEVADPLILEITADRWTTVISNNKLLRELLNNFLLHVYPIYYFFPKDLFLQDMANQRDQFCSPLLVNAVLAISYLSYRKIPNRTKFWFPTDLGYQFTAEAKRLLELELPGQASLTTIQAEVILSVVMMSNGLGRIGTHYLEQALTLAHEISLFEKALVLDDQKMQRAKTFTAWTLFSFQSKCTYYFFRPPYLLHHPKTPLPDPIAQPEWYGDVWLRYPQSRILVPSNQGSTLKARAELHIILDDVSKQIFTGPKTQLSLDDLLKFNTRLDAWFDNLPRLLTSSEIVYPTQIALQYVSTSTGIRLSLTKCQYAIS